MQIKSAYSPASYFNTPYFFVGFIVFSILSGSLITTLITVVLAGIATYAANHFLNTKHTVQSNEAILITGSGAGIGYETSIYLAKRGYTVYAGVRKQADADNLKQQHKLIEPIILDIQKQDDINNAVSEIKSRLQKGNKKLIALVNNAGYGAFSPVELITRDDLLKQYDINVFSLVNVTQAFLPILRLGATASRSTRVINLSSVGGRLTVPNNAVYTSTKYAVESITDGLRMEVKKFNVDVIAVEPGFIKTNFQQTAWHSQDATVENARKTNQYGIESSVLSHYDQSIKKATQVMNSLPWAQPQVVSEQVYNAVADSKPLTRYLAGYDAQITPVATLLPDRIYDLLAGRAFA